MTLNYSGLMCILNFLLDEDKGICNDLGLSFLPLSILKKTQVAAYLNCYFLNCYFYSLKTQLTISSELTGALYLGFHFH